MLFPHEPPSSWWPQLLRSCSRETFLRGCRYFAFALIWGAALGQTPNPRVVDDFEGVKASWRVIPSDSLQEVVVPPRRTDRSALKGHRCEFLAAVGRRGGDTIYITHPLPPSALIDEFAARLWVRGDRTGYQLMVRVRLPRTLDENGEPVSMLLAGDQYQSPGQWQQLSADDLQPELSRMTRVLRARRDTPVDPAEAYVDLVVLNVYGGAGLNRVWMDDLTLEGAVSQPRQRTPETMIRQAAATERVPTTPVSLRDGKLFVEGHPFVARGVTFRGESLATLRQLGFNTVWLDDPPTPSLTEEATRHDMWFVCPPPTWEADSDCGARVIAWCIDPWKANPSQDAQRDINALGSKEQSYRPLAVVSRADRSSALPDADIVIEAAQAAGVASDRLPVWKVLGEPLGAWSRWMLLRQDSLGALADGCQGFLLQTGHSLDVNSPAHARRLAELLNLEWKMMRPWISMGRVHRSEGASYQVALLSNEHSALAVVQQLGAITSSASGMPPSLEIADYARRDVFLIEPGGLSPVRYHRAAGGVRLTLENDLPHAKLLITDRTGVIRQVNRHLRDIGVRFNELLLQAAREELLAFDRRIEHAAASSVFKADLREELHNLQSHYSPVLESSHQAVTYRQLEELLWQLEALQRRL